MSLKERTINVDIMTKEYTKLKYKQGDSNQILKFKFYKNGSELDLTGYVAGIFYEKPNNEILEKTGNISSNTVTTTITNGVLNTAGTVKTEIFLTKDTEVAISFTILIEVETSIDKNAAVQEKEEWDIIKDLLIKADNIAMIDDSLTATNKTWSSSKINSQIKDIGKPTDEQVAAVINQAIADGKITSGNGWSTTAITLFETLISKLAFTDITVGKTLAASLINELKSGSGGSGGSSGGETGGTTPSEETYTITYSLGEATSSNNATTVVKNSSYTTTLSNPASGHISSVVVLMNNVDVTSTVYTEATKTITIDSVIGNLIITVITKSFDNLIIASTCTDGVSMPNGAIITPGTYLITDFIEVTPSTDYYINITRYIDDTNSDWGQGVFYYGSDKTYKGYSQITTNSPMNTMTKYATNDTTYFIRIKFHVNYRNTAYFGLSGVNE